MGRFKKFANHQFKSLVEHLEDYRNKKDQELLHKIRVDIKKIKAILLLTNDRVKGFNGHKNFIPFRTIFRRAGGIREPEVLSSLLLAYNIPGVHDQSIDGNGEKLAISFSNDVHSFIDIVNKQWQKLESAFGKVRKKDLVQYLKKTNKNIKAKLHPEPAIDLIHKVRKSMKEFKYLSQSIQGSRKKRRKFYSAEIELIGDLHDRQVLLNLLNKGNGAADKVTIEKIQKECDAKKDKIKKRALRFYRS
ncbi:MAG: CHAD domain-containing protein [Bacteroidetes bacterium]|nr:CHAD domain-containing protein [Bacteroidota bacterium]